MRTDLTRACPECRTRTFPQERCPKCDNALVDLRDPEAQTRVLEAAWHRDVELEAANRRVTVATGHSIWKDAFYMVALLAGGIAFGEPMVALAIAAGLTGLLVWANHKVHQPSKRLLEDYRNPAKPNLILAPRTAVAAASKLLPAATARGKVRMRTPCRSPLGNEVCAAFRLVGSCGAFVVDDAGGATFDLLVDGSNNPVAVELTHAILDLPSPRPTKLDDRLRQHLQDFLARRGIVPGRLNLGESLLRDGDVVDITGPSAVVLEPGAYREGTYVRTFRGTAEDPVRIKGTKTA